MVNICIGVVLAGAIAAPALAYSGFSPAANSIHQLYLILCPQRPEHSYFLLGQQLALEEREMAMFGAQLAAGVMYAYLRRRSAFQLHSAIFAVATVPFAWDIVSQSLNMRTSDWLTRSWTSALFIVAFVFWCYPRLKHEAPSPGGQSS
jgi:uncharacterized membrane protein